MNYVSDSSIDSSNIVGDEAFGCVLRSRSAAVSLPNVPMLPLPLQKNTSSLESTEVRVRCQHQRQGTGDLS